MSGVHCFRTALLLTKRNETRRDATICWSLPNGWQTSGRARAPNRSHAMRCDTIRSRFEIQIQIQSERPMWRPLDRRMICMCLYEIKMGRDEVVWNGGWGEGRTNSGDCLGYQRESQLLSDKENICLFEQINNSALAVLHTHYTYIYICYKHYMSIIFHILLHHCFVPAFRNKIKYLFKFCCGLSTWVFKNSALHIYPSIPLSFMSTTRVRSSFGAFAIRLCLCTLLLITHHIVAIVAIAIYVSFCCVCCSAGRQLICILIPAHTRSRRLI